MISEEYKGWSIFCDEATKEHISSNFKYIYYIWTEDKLDMVAEKFATLEDAKKWVDDQGGS